MWGREKQTHIWVFDLINNSPIIQSLVDLLSDWLNDKSFHHRTHNITTSWWACLNYAKSTQTPQTYSMQLNDAGL